MEKGVKDPRSLSLPIIRPSSAHGAFFDRVEHGSLGRREAASLHVSFVFLLPCICCFLFNEIAEQDVPLQNVSVKTHKFQNT